MKPDLFLNVLPFTEARRLALGAAVPIDRTEAVTLLDALTRVAAEQVVAASDVPPFDRAAMDGYALRSSDVQSATPQSPARLSCIGQVFAGEVLPHEVQAGQCAEIGTGAPLPAGANAVVMVERTSRDRDDVLVHQPVSARQNVGPRGGDIPSGHTVIRAGDYIGAARVGVLAAIGTTTLTVFARPTVAIVSTGHEVVATGEALRPGQIYDVNSLTLHSIVSQHGGVPGRLPLVDDSVEALTAALEAASTRDVIVCSGGSSVGGRDLLVDALRSCGRIVFHGIAVKPGKPTLFGYVRDTPVFGMPGNPTSCLSNAYILLVPFLRRTARLPPWMPATISLPLARPIAAADARHQFYSVRIVDGRAEPAFKSSGDITSMANADGFIEIAAGVPGVEQGEIVKVTLF